MLAFTTIILSSLEESVKGLNDLAFSSFKDPIPKDFVTGLLFADKSVSKAFPPTKLVKRAGEYSTSFIIDLELQKRIEEFLDNKPPTLTLTRTVLDQKMRDSKMVDGLYNIADRESITMTCKEKESPVSVFLDIMSWMRREGIPVCGGASFAKQKIDFSYDAEISSQAFILVGVAPTGGYFGSYLGSQQFNNTTLRYLLALVLLIASVKLLVV